MKLNQNLLADIFQNGMIFPLNKDFKVGGYIQPNQAVEVEFDGKRYLTKSSNNGKWCVIIPAVSDPTYVGEITVHAGKQIQIIKNIKFGHVYLLSGQSNIEYRLKDETHYKNVISDLKNKKYSNFYYYNVPQVDYIDHENGDIKPKALQYVSKVRIKDQKLTLEIARCSQLVLKEDVFLKVKYFDDSFETVRLTDKNIRKNEVVLDLKETFLGVSYAYKNYPRHIGLYNELGYSVSPFKYEYKKKMF